MIFGTDIKRLRNMFFFFSSVGEEVIIGKESKNI